MVSIPTAKDETTPAVTEALEFEELQTPPETASSKVAGVPMQRVVGPVIEAVSGIGLTVTAFVTWSEPQLFTTV